MREIDMKKIQKSMIHVCVYFFIAFNINIISAQNLDSLFLSGENKLNSKDFQGALVDFEMVLEKDKTYAPAMVQLAYLSLRFENMEKAQIYIRNAVEMDREQYIDTFNKINEINTIMSDGVREMKKGRFDEAYQLYGTVLEQFPYYADAVFGRGAAKYKKKEFDSAIGYFSQVLELNSKHEQAKVHIKNVVIIIFKDANNSYRRGDLEGALVAYYRVLEMDNNFYRAYYQIGRIQAKMKNLSSAIESYLKALKIKPDFLKCWYSLGLARKNEGDKEGALDAFNQVIEIDSSYVKAYSSLGEIYIGLKEYTKAFEVLNTATKVDSSDSKSYYFLGKIYIELKQFEKSVENLEKGVAVNPEFAMAWLLLAEAHNELGNCEAAKAAAREVTERRKNFGGGWYELGRAEWCKGSGNKTVALNYLEKARKDRTWREQAEYDIKSITQPK